MSSTSRVKLHQRITDFVRDAQTDPTLSSQDFHDWWADLSNRQRKTVKGILIVIPEADWHACQVKCYNIVELVHWLRKRLEGDVTNNEDGDFLEPDLDKEKTAKASDQDKEEAEAEKLQRELALARCLAEKVEGLCLSEDDQPAREEEAKSEALRKEHDCALVRAEQTSDVQEGSGSGKKKEKEKGEKEDVEPDGDGKADKAEDLCVPEHDQHAQDIHNDLELILTRILAFSVVTFAPIELLRFLLVLSGLYRTWHST